MTQILAEVTSRGRRKGRAREGDDIRWAELTVYWTGGNDGHYVIEAVRRSDVYHSFPTDCEAYEAHRILTVARDLADGDDRPCYRCKPRSQDDLEPFEVVLTEVDRVEVRHVVNPAEAVQACIDMTGDGSVLTDLAKRALIKAGNVDPDIRSAFYDMENGMPQEFAS